LQEETIITGKRREADAANLIGITECLDNLNVIHKDKAASHTSHTTVKTVTGVPWLDAKVRQSQLVKMRQILF
jgi:hypothetical protein